VLVSHPRATAYDSSGASDRIAAAAMLAKGGTPFWKLAAVLGITPKRAAEIAAIPLVPMRGERTEATNA
jgi:hypothetical protein